MCGIAGFIGSQKIDMQRVKKGCDEMSHRGPDDARFISYEKPKLNVILGHKRLSN